MEAGRPVFLIDARDPAAAATLDAYISLASAQGASQRHLERAQRAREKILAWQQDNPSEVQVPD